MIEVYYTPNNIPIEKRSIFSINECLKPSDNVLYIEKEYTNETFKEDVLNIVNTINEDGVTYNKNTDDTKNPKNIDMYAWTSSITNQMSMGSMLVSLVGSMLGKLWSCRAVDFGSQFYVECRYNNYQSGLTASASFLIILKDKNYGVVKQSSARWRTVNSLGDAVAYISAKARPLAGRTTTI